MKRHSKYSEVQSTRWEKIIAYHVSDKGLILKTHMNPYNTMNTKKKHKRLQRANALIQTANEHIEGSSKSLVIRAKKIQTTISITSHQLAWL